MTSHVPAFIWMPRTLPSSSHRPPTLSPPPPLPPPPPPPSVNPSTSRYQATLRVRSLTVSDAASERSRNDSGRLRSERGVLACFFVGLTRFSLPIGCSLLQVSLVPRGYRRSE